MTSRVRDQGQYSHDQGHRGGRPQEGSLPPEVDAAESRQCAAKHSACHAAKQRQTHARRGPTACCNGPCQRTASAGSTALPTLAGQAGASGVCPESQQQTAAAGNSNNSRALPPSDGQECVGAGVGGSIRVNQLRLSSRQKLSRCHCEGLPTNAA